MSLYLIARSTHIFAMMLTIVLVIAVEPVFLHAARASDVAQVERRYRLTEQLRQLSQLMTLVGLIAAVTMVVLGGWNPLAPWLLATYGLLALMSVVGRTATSWHQQIQAVLQPDGSGRALANVRGLLLDRRALLARVTIIAILFTMLVVVALWVLALSVVLFRRTQPARQVEPQVASL